MKTNKAGIDLIKSFEGFEEHAYFDKLGGVWTIGYGFTRGVKRGDHMTRAQGEERLRKELTDYEKAVEEAVRVPLNENEFAALVSLCWNIGPAALKKSTLVRELNNGNRGAAADQFLVWNKSGDPPAPVEGLSRRRRAERELFLKPTETPLPARPAPAPAVPPAPAAEAPGAPKESVWRLVCPAEDATSARPVSEDVVDALTEVARQLGPTFPFRRDEVNKKLYFGRSEKRQLTEVKVKTPRAPGATAAAVVPADPISIKDRMKPGDVHIVADRVTRTATAWAHDGTRLWKEALEVRLEGVEGGTLSNPIWWVTAGDTPPGLWEIYRVEKLPRSDPDWAAYGWYYLYMRPLDGPAAKIGDVGIGWHGGGSASPDPWARRQGWYDTEGCLRSQNEDLENVLVPVVRKALDSGKKCYVTTK